jgi:hypothetical protein
MSGMPEKKVNLNDNDAEAVRALAAETGLSPADLIPDVTRQAVTNAPERRFRSLGQGRGDGASPRPRWGSDELYDKAFRGR